MIKGPSVAEEHNLRAGRQRYPTRCARDAQMQIVFLFHSRTFYHKSKVFLSKDTLYTLRGITPEFFCLTDISWQVYNV
jgi:hypothetical protein